jgi:hypothetical protein
MRTFLHAVVAFAVAAVVLCPSARADEGADLAQDLTNPVADLLTIPIQLNYDQNFGPADDGWKLQTNIQPVLPFNLNDDWNLITRTIMPVIWQDEIVPGAGSQFGLGDITVSLLASPKKPTNGVIWGVGPILYLRTATDQLLGAEKWGAGPSAIALTMRGRWTMGALANHVWSFAGSDDREDINSTFVQPPSWPTPSTAPGPSRSSPRPPTTWRSRSGRCRSTWPPPSWS